MEETPKVSNKNNEIHDLRYRISQLEHLFVNSTISSPSQLNNTSFAHAVPILPSDLRAIRTQHELIERISDLEGLLAASELENQNLRQELTVMDMDKKRDDVILLEKLYAKDKDVKRLEGEVHLLETKLGKADRALENVKEYINTLPSQEELDESKDSVVRLESDNHVFHQKNCSMEGQLKELRKELIDKNRLIEEQKFRLEEIQPLEEASTSILRSSDDGSMNLNDEKYVKELITIQKAQILKSAKMVTALREKLNQSHKEKDDLKEKISGQAEKIDKFQTELLAIQLTLEKTAQKLKMSEQENLSLVEEKAELRDVLERREKFISERDTQFSNIIKLVVEVDLCVNDVRKLVELGENIAKGEEPPVSSLLGLSDELEMHLQSLHEEQEESYHKSISSPDGTANTYGRNENSLVGKYLSSINSGTASVDEKFVFGDMEWVLDRLKKIRDLRQNIGFIRDQVNDIYTDMIGGKAEGCAVQ